MAVREEEADVVIVGGGPSGLAAATELRRLGAGRVIILDRDRQAGGIPRHCGHYPFGMREFHQMLRGPDYARRLAEQAQQAGVEIRTLCTVIKLHPGGLVEMTTPEGLARLRGKAVLLATGVRETSRAGRMIGGEKPGGILPTGALQGMVYLNGRRPFRRPVILGSELVSFSALLTCRHAGIRPLAMIEAGPRPVAYGPSRLLAMAMGVPFHADTRVEAILGRHRVEQVSLSGPKGTRVIETDGVIVTGGFRPEASLLTASHMDTDPRSGGPAIDQYGRLSDPAYFASGNVLRGVETAGWSWAEGKQVAHSIVASLDGKLAPREDALTIALEGAIEDALENAHDGDALKLVLPQVLVCGYRVMAAHRHLQLRLNRPARGRLILKQAGKVLTEKRIASRPERRILLALPEVFSVEDGELRLVFDEE